MSGTEKDVPVRKRRRKLWWSFWILGGALVGAALYGAEPPVYRASTNILIIPPRVPEWMVKPTVTATLNDQLNVVAKQILARTRLERLIQEFNLYEAERRTMLMEDVVERMRLDISLNIPMPRGDRDPNNFSVSFTSPDPRRAMQVTERLASLFVQENVQDRAVRADQTDQFLKTELNELRRRLERSEQTLTGARGHGFLLSPLTAEHEVLVARYKELYVLSEQSRTATSLEQRQIGEQFQIIDGARLPERPIAPRMFPYLTLGALSGFGAGIVASFFLFVWRRGRPRPVAA
jgi:uncharacterized protein involved in exopolysaccharide biosynthesis